MYSIPIPAQDIGRKCKWKGKKKMLIDRYNSFSFDGYPNTELRYADVMVLFSNSAGIRTMNIFCKYQSEYQIYS